MELKKTRPMVVGFAFYQLQSDLHLWSVVLMKKKRPDFQSGKLNGVGGKVELGESPSRAMVREFEEETGVYVPREKWVHFHSEKHPDNALVHFYSTLLAHSDKVRTRTDEEIVRLVVEADSYGVCDLKYSASMYGPPIVLMYNLCYLIPMALAHLHVEPRFKNLGW
jgi:8-oxo-dGTP pyrophosphatase MutT (NUDIX family)